MTDDYPIRRRSVFHEMDYHERCELAMLLTAAILPIWERDYASGPAMIEYHTVDGERRSIPRESVYPPMRVNPHDPTDRLFDNNHLPHMCLLFVREHLHGAMPLERIRRLADLTHSNVLEGLTPPTLFRYLGGAPLDFPQAMYSRASLIEPYQSVLRCVPGPRRTLSLYTYCRMITCVASLLQIVMGESVDADWEFDLNIANNVAEVYCGIEVRKRQCYDKRTLRQFWHWFHAHAVPFAYRSHGIKR